ncbi:MAG: CDP-glycerol glycerophosphotransferase family protein [Aeromonas sp.]
MLIIKILLSLISFLLPVKKNRLLFGSWSGKRYGDNAKYFYEYLTAHHPEYDCYWYVADPLLAQKVRQSGGNVLVGRSLKSFWYHFTAQAVFCNCHQSTDVWGLALNAKTITFNLWHGTPIKYIGADAVSAGIGDIGSQRSAWHWRLMTGLKQVLRRCGRQEKVYFLASSAPIATIYQRAFDLTAEQVIVAPYPKLRLTAPAQAIANTNHRAPLQILFAPTYRGEYYSEFDILSAYGFDIPAIEAWLQEINAELIIRLHPANTLPQAMLAAIDKSGVIRVDSKEDLYTNFSSIDAVITDFSSVYYDALALNKIAMLVPFDQDSYQAQERKLYFSVDELIIGPLAQTWPEIIEQFAAYVTPSAAMQARQQALRDEYYPHSLAQHPSAVLLEKIQCKLTA